MPTEEQPIEAVFYFDTDKFNAMDEEEKFSLLLSMQQIVAEQLTVLILENNSKK